MLTTDINIFNPKNSFYSADLYLLQRKRYFLVQNSRIKPKIDRKGPNKDNSISSLLLDVHQAYKTINSI